MSLQEKGSVSVIVALFMVVLMTILAFVINTGYLYGAKSRYENAADAAALAGAARLCMGDAEAVAKQVAMENNVPANAIIVQPGFYDVNDAYTDFSIYKDFVGEGEDDFPDDEYNNAVFVEIVVPEQIILGGFLGKNEPTTTVKAAAVAYLRRYDLVSLKDGGEIKLRGKYENGNIYGNGDIKYPDEPSSTFNQNVRLYASGDVLECPVQFGWSGTTIKWNNGYSSGLDQACPATPEVSEIRTIDDAFIASLKAQADIVYVPGDAGKDAVFYGASGNQYYFDFTQNYDPRKIFFFDAQNNNSQAWIKPSSSSLHTPAGDTISNITFATTCDIIIDNGDPIPGQGHNYYLHIGAPDTEHVLIITPGSIKLYYGEIWLEGVFFRCGGDFSMPPSHGDYTWAIAMGGFQNRFRAIADGDIKINYPLARFNFKFGPPCPPAIVKLGVLTKVYNQ